MNICILRELSTQIVDSMPWLRGIESHEQYKELIQLMEELVEDYDSNSVLIDLLFPVIERYEEDSEHFLEFNRHMAKVDPGKAMLTLIIDQYKLTYSDLPEIGGKSLVSLILKGERSLTLTHIKALSERFKIPRYMFV